MNRSRTHTNTHRKPRTLPKAFVKNREIKKNISSFVRFSLRFCCFYLFFYNFLILFFILPHTCAGVRARVAYLCWSWMEFFSYILHQYSGRTFAALNCAASPTDFFFAHFLPFFSWLFYALLLLFLSSIRKCNNLVAKFLATQAVIAWHLAK